jgi:hypothetical protein
MFDIYGPSLKASFIETGGDDFFGIVPDSPDVIDLISNKGMVVNATKQLRLLPNFTNYLQRMYYPVQFLKYIWSMYTIQYTLDMTKEHEKS